MSEKTGETHILAGNYVMLRLPSENFRVVQMTAGSVINLGKFGSFRVDDVIGNPFGFTYEIGEGDNLSLVNNEFTLDEGDSTVELAPEENNQLLKDDPNAQALTMDDIEELKKQGLSGKDIIDKVKSSHASFDMKTAFSKEKYIKRKQQKFLQRFTPEPIGSSELVDIYLDKDPVKIQGISIESLGLVMSMANIHPGGQYLVVDDISGVLVAAMLERMDGEGQIVVCHENEHANLDALRYMNFPSELVAKVVKTINWLEFLHPEEVEAFVEKPAEEVAEMKSTQRGQYYRRRQKYEDFKLAHSLIEATAFSGLAVITTLHMPTLLPRLISAISGSAPVVLYSEYKELLVETTHVLHKDLRVLAPTIIETRVRKYQTLPGRMHPHMTSRGGGGFVLWGTRVTPSQVHAVGKTVKKRKAVAVDSPTSTQESS